MKAFIFCTTATLALAAGFAAAAQEAHRLSEIVVTAQRREERLKDVPISVTALSAANLAAAGVSNSRDIALVTPGLRFDAIGSNPQPTIRGVTTTLTAISEMNVATYVDGVYQP